MLAKGQENVTRQQSITSCQKLQRGQESEELKSVCLMQEGYTDKKGKKEMK